MIRVLLIASCVNQVTDNEVSVKRMGEQLSRWSKALFQKNKVHLRDKSTTSPCMISTDKKVDDKILHQRSYDTSF